MIRVCTLLTETEKKKLRSVRKKKEKKKFEFDYYHSMSTYLWLKRKYEDYESRYL